MQVTFSFAGEVTQVLDAIPWVRCASGNVYFYFSLLFTLLYFFLLFFFYFVFLSIIITVLSLTSPFVVCPFLIFTFCCLLTCRLQTTLLWGALLQTSHPSWSVSWVLPPSSFLSHPLPGKNLMTSALPRIRWNTTWTMSNEHIRPPQLCWCDCFEPGCF